MDILVFGLTFNNTQENEENLDKCYAEIKIIKQGLD